jgi:hypothetical protein
MSDLLNSFIKDSGNKYASLVSGGLDGADVRSDNFKQPFSQQQAQQPILLLEQNQTLHFLWFL